MSPPSSLLCLQISTLSETKAGADEIWACNSAIAAILDTLAAIVSLSGSDSQKGLPAECSRLCETLLAYSHPLVKVKIDYSYYTLPAERFV